MTTIEIEYPNRTPNGLFRAVAMADFEVLEIVEANTFCAAADELFSVFSDAVLSDEAREQVMVEQFSDMAA